MGRPRLGLSPETKLKRLSEQKQRCSGTRVFLLNVFPLWEQAKNVWMSKNNCPATKSSSRFMAHLLATHESSCKDCQQIPDQNESSPLNPEDRESQDLKMMNLNDKVNHGQDFKLLIEVKKEKDEEFIDDIENPFMFLSESEYDKDCQDKDISQTETNSDEIVFRNISMDQKEMETNYSDPVVIKQEIPEAINEDPNDIFIARSEEDNSDAESVERKPEVVIKQTHSNLGDTSDNNKDWKIMKAKYDSSSFKDDSSSSNNDSTSGDILETTDVKEEIACTSLNATHTEQAQKKPYKCNICNRRFAQRQHLRGHTLTHTDEKPYKCKYCPSAFSWSSNLVVHMRTHTGEKPFSCNMCHAKFTWPTTLKLHMYSHTGRNKSHICTICNKAFFLKGVLKQHMKTHSGQKTDSCHICGKQFCGKKYLSQHMLIHASEKPHKCTECDKAFTMASYLKHHMLSHKTDKSYICAVCSKLFKYKSTLKTHTARFHKETTHETSKPYSCDVCSRKFKKKSSLQNHMSVHTGNKPHVCVICAKEFRLKWYLNHHMRIHGQQKTHTCEICKKMFFSKSSLNGHMLIHTGEKPFACTVCEKAFTKGSDLRRHMLTHTKEKPFACMQCSMSFAYKETLRNHIKRLHKEVSQGISNQIMEPIDSIAMTQPKTETDKN